jgi:hypothetical protein
MRKLSHLKAAYIVVKGAEREGGTEKLRKLMDRKLWWWWW